MAERLFLVDGYALIYRAFFAMIARPLTTRRGENTSAAWGVTNFLLRLYEKYQPRYLGWIHDRGVSFRQREYAEYKATREKLDEELQQDFDRSLERIGQILAGFRVPILGVDGYEADDVIATLATVAVARGLEAVIVSGDKDFYQLVRPGIALLNPGRGGSAGIEEHWVDESNAGERLGVPPARVVDYLALVGDTSDNVPGVKGIGGKTAVDLIQKYGDLDAILARAAEIPGKRPREALLEHGALARLSRQLVTLQSNVPMALDLDALRVQPPDVAALTALFAELEFRTLIPKLATATPPPAAAEAAPRSIVAAPLPEASLVSDPAALAAIVAEARAARLVALHADPALVGLAVAVSPDRSWYLPFGHRPPSDELVTERPPVNLPPLGDPQMAPLRALLADAAVPKAAHDIKAVWRAVGATEEALRGVAYDSMLASFVLDPGRRSHAIDDLARERLAIELPSVESLVGKGKAERPLAELPPGDVGRLMSAYARTVLRLETALRPELEDHQLVRLLEEIELPLVAVLVSMERTGILVDRALLGEMSRGFAKELATLERDIYRAAGGEFNINSTLQLRTVLFDKLKLPVQKRTKTGASTDYEVLEQLAAMGHEVPRLMIEFRELIKLKSTYVDALPGYINAATGRVHTSFNQTGASTGRLSSSDPNLQNIPIRTKRGG
jgi:DNA polymerase-1